jgi:hypothetical protein
MIGCGFGYAPLIIGLGLIDPTSRAITNSTFSSLCGL